MSDNLFHIIEDAHVIVRSKGVFRQAKVYRRGERLFAGYGAGFIRLGSGDSTSAPGVAYEDLDMPPTVVYTPRTQTQAPLFRGNAVPMKAAA